MIHSEYQIKDSLNLLKSKHKHKNIKYKTKLCVSVLNGEKCPHGEKCRFAHDKSELKLNKCFFGKECRFVKYLKEGNEFINIHPKKCLFIHPGETEINYKNRLKDNLKKCYFGSNCKLVSIDNNGNWININNEKKCMCYHPGESERNYKNRIRYIKIKKSGIILFDNNKILLVKNRRTNLWGFPKGSVENFDKNLKYAAIRELKEETGYIIDYESIEKGILIFRDFILFNVNIKNIIEKRERTDHEEILTQNFFTLEEIKEMDRRYIDGSVYKFILKYL